MQHVTRYRNMTVGEYLKQNHYSKGFVYNYFLPMCAAVWSAPNSKVGFLA